MTSIREREGGRVRFRLTAPGERAGTRDHGEFVEHDRRILDGDAVGRARIRWQRDHAVPKKFEDLFAGAMLGLGAREVDRLAHSFERGLTPRVIAVRMRSV